MVSVQTCEKHARVYLAIYTAVSALLLATGYWAQSTTYLNHDVSWVLYSSRDMLGGAEFGTDILAANPPLIWWLSLLPNAIAKLLGTSIIPTFRLFIMALIVLSLLVCDWLLASDRQPILRRAAFVLTAAFFLTFAVGRDFGQREQLSLLLVLPYILLAAQRGNGCKIGTWPAVLIGLAAGIGVAFKPYFLIVPGLVELALLLRLRSIRAAIRPETISAGLAFVAYLLAVFLFAYGWLFDAMPRIARIYWAFEQPLSGIFLPLLFQFGPPALMVVILIWRGSDILTLYLALAALGFFGAAVIQGKFYSYHLFPAYALLMLTLAAGGFAASGSRWRIVAAGFLLAAIILDLPNVYAGIRARTESGEVGSEIAEVSQFVARNVSPAGSFVAISTHPFPGFPTALYAERRWASESNSRLFLPAVVRLREMGSEADPALKRMAEAEAWDSMVRDLANEPEIVLVDRRPYRHAIGDRAFDFLAFYLEDPRVRQQWSAYRRMERGPTGFDAFVRLPEIGR